MKYFLVVAIMVSMTALNAKSALISKWNLDENSGASEISDSSGNSHHGMLTATGVVMGGSGTGYNGTGGAAYFNGTGGYINTTNGVGEYSAGKYLENEATISFWEKADSDISNYGAIFSAYTIRCVMTYGGTVYWDTYASSLTTGIQPSDYQQWSFWTLTRDASNGSGTISIYRDGQLIATSAGGYPAINSYGDMKIGIDGGGGTFKGYIDEVRVYNDALNSSDVQSLYSSYVPEPATVALLGVGGLIISRRKVVKQR